MDLHDLEHNTRDGLHIASLAGAWIAAVAGFGGMRDHDGELTLRAAPAAAARAARLPACLPRPAAEVDVTKRDATYTLLDGDPLETTHHGVAITVAPEHP